MAINFFKQEEDIRNILVDLGILFFAHKRINEECPLWLTDGIGWRIDQAFERLYYIKSVESQGVERENLNFMIHYIEEYIMMLLTEHTEDPEFDDNFMPPVFLQVSKIVEFVDRTPILNMKESKYYQVAAQFIDEMTQGR